MITNDRYIKHSVYVTNFTRVSEDHPSLPKAVIGIYTWMEQYMTLSPMESIRNSGQYQNGKNQAGRKAAAPERKEKSYAAAETVHQAKLDPSTHVPDSRTLAGGGTAAGEVDAAVPAAGDHQG